MTGNMGRRSIRAMLTYREHFSGSLSMNSWQAIRNGTGIVLLISLLIVGCGKSVDGGKGAGGPGLVTELGVTIGALVEVVSVDTINVEGYALVGGLKGTGSEQCPPQIKSYLKQYILKQLSEGRNIERFISSRNTAVVRVEGTMPITGLRYRYFDVKVSALPGTQTTSLQGGQLLGADLYEAGRFGIGSKILAEAEGPIFIDPIGDTEQDKKVGSVLAGGTVLGTYKISLGLRRPDYRVAASIRDRLNGRFGETPANAVSPSIIELEVPARYRQYKNKFISIVKATYLIETAEFRRERIEAFAKALEVSDDKETSEIALEALGKESLGKLAGLVNSPSEEVRLRAARCMLNLGSRKGLLALRRIATDPDSPYRIEAMEAVATWPGRQDATALLRRLLRDEDFNIRLAAYKQLRQLGDISIIQELIGRNFYLEQIPQAKHPTVFVSRSGMPRIVLFAGPIYCRENIFIKSLDNTVTINAASGQKYVTVMRKHPTRPELAPVELKSSPELGDIIRTLCEEPVKKTGKERVGLGVSYADTIAILKLMCEKGAVQAEFHAGSLPKIE